MNEYRFYEERKSVIMLLLWQWQQTNQYMDTEKLKNMFKL